MTDAPEKEIDEGAEASQAEPVIEVATETESEGSPESEPSEDEIIADDGDDAGEELSVLEALEAKVAELSTQKKDTYERLLRSTADLDNFRKRSRREIEDARVEARSRTLREILPVIDNLQRAMTHASDSGGDGIVDGVKLVMRQFEQALAKFDVKVIEAKDSPFDPNFHEAMSQIPTAEAEPGTVIQVLQQGYRIGERLLRPALVVVAKAPPLEELAAGANGKSASASAAAEEASTKVEVSAEDAAIDDAAESGEGADDAAESAEGADDNGSEEDDS